MLYILNIKNHKTIFGIILALSLLIVLSSAIIGKKQNHEFKSDGYNLMIAQQYLDEGKYKEAEEIYLNLETKYPDSAPLAWLSLIHI